MDYKGEISKQTPTSDHGSFALYIISRVKNWNIDDKGNMGDAKEEIRKLLEHF